MNTTSILKELFQNISISIKYFRIQDYFHGNIAFKKIINSLNSLLPLLENEELSLVVESLQSVLKAQTDADYILLCDLLEASLLPLIKQMTETRIFAKGTNFDDYFDSNIKALKTRGTKYSSLIDSIYKNHKLIKKSNRYIIEQTNIDVPTLKVHIDNKDVYFHSNLNPYEEGDMLAEYYSKPDIFNYNIFGFGLGYHIRGFLDYDRRFKINVIETNIDTLTYAFIYCDLSDIILNERFSLEYCQINELGTILSNTSGIPLIIHYPSLSILDDSPAKHLLNDYFINISSMYSQGKYLDWNFYYNMKLQDKSVDTLKDVFKNKNITYVAAGPSLIYCFDYLRDQKKENSSLIICASTIYRTLINKNIIPDYVIMTDAQDNMISHVENINETGSSLIYLSTACSNAVSHFVGNRYIVFQNGYEPAEKFAFDNNFSLIETGGSVSTTALDLILKFNCKSLTTIGLDLAYTDNKSHSYDSQNIDTAKRYINVKSVTGNIVPTTNILNIYRKWIENRIENVTSVELINFSKGAYIKGMKNIIC